MLGEDYRVLSHSVYCYGGKRVNTAAQDARRHSQRLFKVFLKLALISELVAKELLSTEQ